MKLYEYILKFKENATQKLKEIERASGQTTQKVNLVDRAFGRLRTTVAGLAIGAALFAGVKGAAALGIEMEQTRVSFTTFLKSADKANETIAKLNDFSNVTPFDNAQVIKAGKGLLAFGTTAEDLIPTLKRIGDISAGTGKDFNELAIIYGKARIAGTLYAEDINQLVEAGVPIMGEFAKALGTTEDKVKKMASEGKLKFKDLEQAFTNLTSEGGLFFDLMAKQSETVGGKISTFFGKVQTRGIQLGEAMLPLIGRFTDWAIALLDNDALINQFVGNIKALWEGFTDALLVFSPFVDLLRSAFDILFQGAGVLAQNTELFKVIGRVVGIAAAAFIAYNSVLLITAAVTKGYVFITGIAKAATILFTQGVAGLNTVLALNPIGLVVAAIVALIGVVVWAYQEVDWFRGTIWGLWEVMKDLGTILLDGVIKIITGAIDLVVGLGKALWNVMTGDFPAAIEAGQQAIGGAKSLVEGIVDTNPLGIAIKHGERLGAAFSKGYDDGIKDFAQTNNPVGDMLAKDPLLAGAGAGTGSGAGADDTKLADGIKDINGGGSKAVNVTVNLNNLIGEQKFNITNLKEDLKDMEDEVVKALLRVLGSANQAAAQ